MRSLPLIALLTIAACSPPHVQQFPEKPSSCALEVVTSLPQRAYTEIETIELPSLESMRDVVDHVQTRACHDGADAIYAPKGGRVYSYAIALKWKE